MLKIYTKKGDGGTTSLYNGELVSKLSPRICAVGDLDETNAAIGCALSTQQLQPPLEEHLIQLQKNLFEVGAAIADPKKTHLFSEEYATQLEQWIDQYDAQLPPLTAFILPGGSQPSAQLHLARCCARRAERALCVFGDEMPLAIRQFLNRLSDFLFVAARMANHQRGCGDVLWHT